MVVCGDDDISPCILCSLLYKGCRKRVENKILKSILSRASFSISDSVNDLVYYQLLMW